MFSRLDAIFRNNFLPLKEGDTYPGRKPDDEESPRKRNAEESDDKTHKSSDFGDDLMVVSVNTLLAFLNELTHAPDIKHDFKGKNKIPNGAHGQDKEKQHSKSRETERAINAYRHMAEANNPTRPQKIEGRIDRMLFHLDEEEKQILSTLISELEGLHKKGVYRLEIPGTRNFFSGIIEAVTAVQKNLS